MFAKAYIEELSNHRLRHEESLVVSECERRGIQVEFYTAKRIHRRRLNLTAETFICGDMDAMHGAMKQMEIDIPKVNDFPECLSAFLHRRVWRSTLSDLTRTLFESSTDFFAKPAGRRKLFTGRVFGAVDDLYHISGVSQNEPIWCSQVVEWRSEYRVYVVGEHIVSVDHYSGDPCIHLSLPVVKDAVLAYRQSGFAPSAYGIDFGVLDTGETALVEANDGYALGAYQIDAASYTELLFARWSELVANKRV